jgi:hypothetical protein
MAQPDVVYARHPGRDRAEFMTTEFRAARRHIYEMAARTLTTTDSVESDWHRLADLIRELMDIAAP